MSKIKLNNHLLLKYNSTPSSYSKYLLKSLLYNKNTHFVSVFKDCLIYDDISEFISCYYNKYLITEFITKYAIFSRNFKKCYPSYRSLDIQRIMLHNRSQKVHLKDQIAPSNQIKKYSTILPVNLGDNSIKDESDSIIINNSDNDNETTYSIDLNIVKAYDYKMLKKNIDFIDKEETGYILNLLKPKHKMINVKKSIEKNTLKAKNSVCSFNNIYPKTNSKDVKMDLISQKQISPDKSIKKYVFISKLNIKESKTLDRNLKNSKDKINFPKKEQRIRKVYKVSNKGMNKTNSNLMTSSNISKTNISTPSKSANKSNKSFTLNEKQTKKANDSKSPSKSQNINKSREKESVVRNKKKETIPPKIINMYRTDYYKNRRDSSSQKLAFLTNAFSKNNNKKPGIKYILTQNEKDEHKELLLKNYVRSNSKPNFNK